ncbi:MAG: hypothetical protein H7062_13230, partial [Candidatus Saccharimonas sp.]|nr:hypothetical protein [Planctomycetaceae bacterium]
MHSTRRAKMAAAVRMAIVVVMTLTMVAGCQDLITPGSPSGDGKATVEKGPRVPGGKSAPADQPEPLLADWKAPAAVLLLTGEQHGYLEPCGCSIHQLGGMARRADLVRILTEERKWPVAGLDVGGTPKKDRRQDQIKYLALLDAFKTLNYGAVAIGLEELKLGADYLLQQQVADPEEAKKAVALVSANVALYDPPLEGWPLASRIVQVGQVKVGVTAIVGLSVRDQVAPVGAMTNITIRDPAEVLPAAIAALRAEKPDFLVLLSHGNIKEAKQLAETFPAFRIILTAGSQDEPDNKPVLVGKTWILETGTKGKRVGVLGYFPDNKKEPFRYDLVTLDDVRFKNDPRMRELMKTYQQQ